MNDKPPPRNVFAAEAASASRIDDVLQLLARTATIANQAATPTEAIRHTLDAIILYSGWSIGHAFLHDPPSGTLRSSTVWVGTDPERFAAFRRLSEAIDCRCGLIGLDQLFAHAAPVWIDLAQAEPSPRHSLALALGLRTAIVVPVVVDTRVVALLECFTLSPLTADPQLLQVVAQIGVQLGRAFERAEHAALHAEISRRETVETALRERLHFAESIEQAMPDVIYVLDLVNGRNLLSTNSLGRILGYPPAAITAFGDTFLWQVLHPSDHEPLRAHVQRCRDLADGEILEMEYRLRAASGEWYWFLSRDLVLKRDSNGAPAQLLGFGRDITARKRAEGLLQDSLERLQLLHAINQSALVLQTPEQIAAAALAGLRKMLPLVRASVLQFEADGQFAYVLAADPLDQEHLPLGTRVPVMNCPGVAQMRAGQALHSADLHAIKQPSLLVQAMLRVGMRAGAMVPMLLRDEIAGVLCTYSSDPDDFAADRVELLWDIANHLGLAIEHSRLFSQVQNGRLRLQVLAKQLLEVQEAERRQIAHELHDELGQVLTALKINLQSMRRSIKPKSAIEHIDENIAIIEVTLQQVRSLSLNLRPTMLDDLGLTATLRWYLDRQERRTHLRILFDCNLGDRRLASITETACFRIVQEAITNVVRHAQAAYVHVRLTAEAHELLLLIRDDGIGFDMQAVELQSLREMSLGLLGMQERAMLLGGHLRIETTTGAGTTIVATLPANYVQADQPAPE